MMRMSSAQCIVIDTELNNDDDQQYDDLLVLQKHLYPHELMIKFIFQVRLSPKRTVVGYYLLNFFVTIVYI